MPGKAVVPDPARDDGTVEGRLAEIRRQLEDAKSPEARSLLAAQLHAEWFVNDYAPELPVRDPGKALPYPVSALPEVLAGATREMIRVIQAADAVAAARVVAAASLVVQAHADVEIDGRVIPLSLWLLKFELDKAAAEARKLDGDAARDHVAAVGDDPEPPLRPQLTAADFTTDGIVRLLTECRPSIGIFSDDGGVVFRSE